METKPKNRAWVKDAAIVFLVVLLLLTFFSNTIMNHSLPEVATSMVSNGTITAKVRGTGTVTANGNHKVKAKTNMTIGRVMVKAGQEVNAGDVLFVLGAADSTELEEAMIALEDLQTQYAQAALSVPLLSDRTGENEKIKSLSKAVTDAQRNMSDLGDKLGVSSDRIQGLLAQKDAILTELNEKRAERDAIDNELTQKKAAMDTAKKYYDDLVARKNTGASTPAPVEPPPTQSGTSTPSTPDVPITASENTPEGQSGQPEIKVVTASYTPGTDPEIDAALAAYEAAKEAYEEAKKNKGPQREALKIRIESLEVTTKEVNAALESISYGTGENKKTWADYLTAQKAYEEAVSAYNTAIADRNYSAAVESRSIASAGAGLSGISNKIKRQQEKIKKLSGEGDANTITANVAGTVTEVNCTAGDSVIKDDILASIEVPDQGYTVSFSVTNDQAKRLHVGDTATISNYYWGNKIVATLATIQTDKKNPMTNKTLTFDLEGDVTSGSEVTLSVGQKSANYDTIIPNSAIRTDSNGSFVLAVTAKSSPLGNRYIAKRVAIEVLAADDTSSAVTADLNNGDYVITTSSAPVASGDMVRLADAEN